MDREAYERAIIERYKAQQTDRYLHVDHSREDNKIVAENSQRFRAEEARHKKEDADADARLLKELQDKGEIAPDVSPLPPEKNIEELHAMEDIVMLEDECTIVARQAGSLQAELRKIKADYAELVKKDPDIDLEQLRT